MKKIITLIFIPLLFFSCKKTNSQQITNKKVVSIIDTAVVKKHLYTLASDDMQGRKPGTKGIEKAAQYIEKVYKRIGLKTFNQLPTFRQNFEYNGIQMFNVLGVLEGKSKKDEFVIVSAHYDHLVMKTKGKGDLIYNGANDDASGVVGVLTLAEYFAKTDTNERSICLLYTSPSPRDA